MRGWLACKQSGEEFEELVVPMFDEEWEKRREGDEFAPSLGKVPILWDGDCVVWDSLAIIEFLADRVGRDRFWPEDDGARGMARSMAAEMHSGFAEPAPRTADERPQELPAARRSAEPVATRSTASSTCGRRPGRGSAAPANICSATGARPTSCSRRSSPASSPTACRSRPSPRYMEAVLSHPPRRRMDREGPGRAVGDRAI